MIIHEFEDHNHRLVDTHSGEQGEWAAYEEVARLKEYGAVTSHHSHNLPSVFRVWELKRDVEYKNVHLGLDSDDYWMGSKEGG